MNAPSSTAEQTVEVDLRNPGWAALLAWLIPGAGHLYQRRTGKGLLFMICIMGTYFFGLVLGDGKVVYASWNHVDRRWQFPLQLGAGLPAFPAIAQSMLMRRGQEPMFNGVMAPPQSPDELSYWHNTLNMRFEIGTLYTMIAGLLNILAIWDAYGGPVVSEPGKHERGPPDEDNSSNKNRNKA